MSEYPISISNLNDFIFCPASIYFHALDQDADRMMAQDTSQINGSAAHEKSDTGGYSSKKSILQGASVYSATYNISGKIDTFDIDIGYTILFSFIDALVMSYGFDTYCGVMHRQFYMRKSLICDLVEPFRVLVDHAVKRGLNLKQIQQDDFLLLHGKYKLKWECSAKYVKLLTAPILAHKNDIFTYIQCYYRAFMKELPAEQFPVWYIGGAT